jgi:CRP-like cAMP-binding protein
MLEKQNSLLATLPISVLERLKRSLSLVEYKQGHKLSIPKQGGLLHFPLSHVFSISIVSDDGLNSFYRFVGSEFFIGAAYDFTDTPLRLEVETCASGYGFTLRTEALFEVLGTSHVLAALTDLSMKNLLEKSIYSAHCAYSHSGSQRLAGALLEAAGSFVAFDSIRVTQKALAMIVRLRRESVSVLLTNWRKQGLIRKKSRGIEITDFEGLRAQACPCFLGRQRGRHAEFNSWQKFTREAR